MSHKQMTGRAEAVGGHTSRQRHPDRNQEWEESIEVTLIDFYLSTCIFLIFN
jgi:hypothetical protein